jgi:hypothetical protein
MAQRITLLRVKGRWFDWLGEKITGPFGFVIGKAWPAPQ